MTGLSQALGSAVSPAGCVVPCVRFNCFVRLSFTSSTVATLGMSGWLDLPQQGLSPCKKRQASLGALTYSVLSSKPGSNQAWERSPKERGEDETCWTKLWSHSAVATMGIIKRRSSAEGGALVEVCEEEAVDISRWNLELRQALYTTSTAVKPKFFFASLNEDTWAEPTH